MRDNIKQFLPTAVAITLTSGLIYAVGLQNLRFSANDPQVQISDDVVRAIESGRDPEQIIPPTKVQIDKSLSVFGIIYDDAGNVIMSAAELDGKTPEIPKGVLDHARVKGQNRVTWKPKSGERVAVVVRRFEGSKPGFILIGRSLREVETRQTLLLKQIMFGWIVILIVTFLTNSVFASDRKHKK